MDEKKTVDELTSVFSEQEFAAGDAWLRSHGILASIQHNAIVANLYVNFPKVQYLEYFLPEDTSRRKVWVILYVPFWKLLFANRDRMVDDVIMFLREYLRDFDIKVELKRYKKGVEKSNEIPETAIDHIAAAPNVQPEPKSDPAPATPSPEPAAEAGSTPADDQNRAEAASPGAADGSSVPPSSDPGEPKS